MEGRENSGALITARCAQEQGRIVYALPGNVGSSTSEVTNLLLKNGARALVSADDIVRDFEIEYHGKLNPFKLAEKSPVDMGLVLSEYKVAATAPSDNIFDHKLTRPKKEKSKAEISEMKNTTPTAPSVLPDFDKETLALYKRIPLEGDIHIESLVDGEHDLRSIMKLLLKLEMGHFILMLPGERVKRNLK